MKLIADSGATSTSWALLSESETRYFDTPGFNPNWRDASEMASELADSLANEGVQPAEIAEIWYYCAGVTELMKAPVSAALRERFPQTPTIVAESDLIGSCRALLGDGAGFAAILGTGLNSCIYNGGGVELCIPGFGFIMGDEGSGGYIGKKFLLDYVRGTIPEAVSGLCREAVGKDYAGLVQRIYRETGGNAYCASFCRFISDNLDTDPYFRNLVLECFRDLFRNVVSLYPNYRDYQFSSVGSVAHFFRAELETVAGEYGMRVGKILREPLPGLVTYHSKS